MTKVDQFESIFRSADKDIYAYERVQFPTVLVITDKDGNASQNYYEQVKSFLSVIELDASVTWRLASEGAFETVQEALDLVEKEKPDLICTYRNLYSEAWRWPHSLGHYVDVLTQGTPVPVLLLPHPDAERASEHAMENTNVVMAVTDHLSGENRLVNYAVRLTERKGQLFLTHIEDDAVFERYMKTISKIPNIDTDMAREEILKQLLKEPRDYIESCREAIKEHHLTLKIDSVVTQGHRLSEYEQAISDHEVDLLVMNTKDEDQLAMHGLAYPLAVQLRQIPLLLL